MLPLAIVLGTILIALAGVSDSSGRAIFMPGTPNRGYVLAAGAVLTAIGFLGQPLRRWKISVSLLALGKLKSQVAGLERDLASARRAHENLVGLELSALADRLKYSSSERISLFVPVGESRFELIGRWSVTTLYRTVPQRPYPVDQGVLGTAWARGEASISDLPSPETDRDNWQRRLLQECGIPNDVSSKLRMRCRTYVAFSIPKTYRGTIGVVVFESQLPGDAPIGGAVLDPAALKRMLKGQWGQQLADLVEIHESLRDQG